MKLTPLVKNGNGTIDSGRELYGDNTLLANGQKTASGYQARWQGKTVMATAFVVGNGDNLIDTGSGASSILGGSESTANKAIFKEVA